MFDAISFFEKYNIEYHTSGKNVTAGWTEINCPFCADPSYHMGINLSSGIHHCWICGTKGGPERLIKKLIKVSFSEAKKIAEEFDINRIKVEKEKTFVEEIIYPKGMVEKLPFLHREYLIKRNFDPDYLEDKYKIKACLHLGKDFAYRIIIPIIMNNTVVSYTSRDVTEKASSKYKHLSNDKSIIAVKDCLYNIDTVKDKIIIVEGVMDAWRIGDSCIALFGLEYTTHQLNSLFCKNLNEAFVLFDSEPFAIRKAHKLGNTLSTFIPKVKVLELDEGDPAELSNKEVENLRKEIGMSATRYHKPLCE
jgi:DNA primase